MKKLIVLLTALAFLAINPVAMAVIVWNDGLTHIIDADLNDWVYLDYDIVTPPSPGTHVDIVDGGEVDLARAYNRSSITMTGGTVVSHLQAVGHSSIIFSGGTVGGTVQANNNGTISMTGGHSVKRVQAGGEGVVTVSGGSVEGSLNVYYDGTIYLDGTDFMVDGIELANGDKLSDFAPLVESGGHYYYISTITGILADNSPLSTHFVIANTGFYAGTANIYIIPEPGTVLLLGFGGMALSRRRRQA